MQPVSPSAVVLRPSWARYRRWSRGPLFGATVIGVVVAIAVARADSTAQVVGVVVVFLVAALLVLGWLALSIRRSVVVLDAGRITHRGIWRQRHLDVADDLVGLLAHETVVGRGIRQTTEILLLRRRPTPGEHGSGPRIRVNGGYYDHDQLLQIAQYAGSGVVVLGPDDPVGDREALVPGLSTWSERHTVALVLVTVLGFLTIVIGGVIAVFVVTDQPPFDSAPPREVSAATVQRQDDVVAGLTAALGGQWDVDAATLSECKDAEGRKGWRREVEATSAPRTDVPREPTDELLDPLGDLMTSHGYVEVTADAFGGDVHLTGEVDGSRPLVETSDVVVTFDPSFPDVTATSGCERP